MTSLSNKFEINIAALENLIAQLPQPHIILGDFNSHSMLWGSHKLDKRGKIVEEFIVNNDLIILNDQSPTHFNLSYGSSSAIDITLCSSSIATSIEWQTSDYLYGSDHYPLTIKIAEPIPVINMHNPRYKFYKAEWPKYKENISKKITDFNNFVENFDSITNIDINCIIEKFNNIIIEAANDSIPITRLSNCKNSIPWWNEECENAIKSAKQAFNKYKKHKNLQNKIEYKRLNALSKRVVKSSTAIVFEKTNKNTSKLHLTIGNDQINIVNEIKILGLTFDSKLNWNAHIETLKKQCSQRLKY